MIFFQRNRLRILFFVNLVLMLFGSVVLFSCGKEKDEPSVTPLPPAEMCDKTVLVYSVASNNLEVNLKNDRTEMIRAASDIAGLDADVRVLLYMVLVNGNPTLSELKRGDSGIWDFSVIKEYDRSRFSTDPARIGEVIDDARRLRPARSYGLMFASHGSGWTPDFSVHSRASVSMKPDTSFGQDKYEGDSDSVDIAELADAIPSGSFEFIWFDACYMAGIETLYQFRDKCDYFVGYVTEIYSAGLPYDRVLPLIVKNDPDLTGAAELLYNTYAMAGDAVSVSVMATAGLDALANVTRRIWEAGVFPSSYSLQKYHRHSFGPFYDFGQMVNLSAEKSGATEELKNSFAESLGKVVLFKRITSFDFNSSPLDPDIYSGLSSALPSALSGARKAYYLSLDWGRAVFPDGITINDN